jgi:formate hydrogenlyase subunit 3/multisubunit Na+/H+ antiporter MnhD subunit
MFGVINLALAVTTVLISLEMIEYPTGGHSESAHADVLWRRPIAGTGLLGGGLALIGWLPSPGGTSYLLTLQAAAEAGWGELSVLLIAMILATLALVQLAVQYLIGPRTRTPVPEPLLLGETEVNRPPPMRLPREPLGASWLVGSLLVTMLVIGIFPNVLLPTIEAAVRSLAAISAM